MKAFGFLATSLVASVSAFAGQSPKGEYHLTDLNFAAPAVYGDPAADDSRLGSIIYDLSTNSFRGLFSNGNWGSLTANASIVPTVTRLTSSSGTYTAPSGVLYIRVRMVGGGGGGSGGSDSTANGGSGTAGGSTSFGGTLLVATGGAGGVQNTSGAAGGTPTVNSPATEVLSHTGGKGSGGGVNFVSSNIQMDGGVGGVNAFGGSGSGGRAGNTGGAGASNTGAGGGGAGGSTAGTTSYAGAGGGAGAYVEAFISNPSGSYSYCIGNSGATCTGGTAGSAGTNGFAGGAGGTGVIIVEEYYQ